MRPTTHTRSRSTVARQGDTGVAAPLFLIIGLFIVFSVVL